MADSIDSFIQGAADILSGALSGFEPQRTNHCTLLLPIDVHVGMAFVPFAVESFTLPKYNISKVSLDFLNEKRHFVGKAEVEDVQIELKDFVDRPILSAVVAWRDKGFNPNTGGVGLAQQYKREARLITFSPIYVPRIWLLKGSWVVSLDPGRYSTAEANKVLINLTLSVDRAVPEGDLAATIVNAGAGAVAG